MRLNVERTGQTLAHTCGTVIGDIVLVNGRTYVHAGALVARSFYWVCPLCGRPYHWDGKTEDERKNGYNLQNIKQ